MNHVQVSDIFSLSIVVSFVAEACEENLCNYIILFAEILNWT